MNVPGSKLRKPTIRDVATRAGVSVGTTSRVINGLTNVGPEIRRRVQQAIDELGFEPNAVAQSMRGGPTRSIGLVLRDIVNSNFAGMVRSTQQSFQDAGYTLLLACHGGDRKRELDIIRTFRKRRVDGVIVGTYSDEDSEVADCWSALGIPIVLYDQEKPDQADSVRISHASAIAEATRHLLGLGHKRIGFLTGPLVTYPARSRLAGFRRAFADFCLDVPERYISTESFDGTLTFGEVTRLLELEDPPTALLLGGIEMLPGAIKAIRARGLTIPRDVSLVGIGESDLSVLTTPPITTIRWNSLEIGYQMARLMLERLRGDVIARPRRLMCEAELVLRESTAPPPSHS